MQRLSGELNTHKPVIEQLLESGKAFQQENNAGQEAVVAEKCGHLSDAWQELLALAEDRYVNKCRRYFYFLFNYSVRGHC